MEIKPRRYKNIEFRSTLEAKWAKFFDLLEWEWKYEPFKLVNGHHSWIPDFIIIGVNEQPIYCEVKPSNSHTDWFDIEKYSLALNFTENKDSTLLLLGQSPLAKGFESSGAAIGWIVQPSTMQVETEMFFNSQPLGICDEFSSWVCKITGEYYSQLLPVNWGKIQELWVVASKEAEALPICQEPLHPTCIVKT